MKIKLAFLELSAEKIYKAMIEPVFTYCGIWVSVGHVLVRVKLKALNVEVRKSLVEIISPDSGEFNIKRDSSANLCLIVFRIASGPLLKDILQKLNTTLTLETMGVH